MFRCICFFICSILFAQTLSCKTNDTTDNYRLKGVDVTIGGGKYNYGNKTAVNLFKAMMPQDIKNNFNYNEVYSSYKTTSPVKIGLNFIFGDNKRTNSFIANKHEYIFRFSFESKQDYNEFNNLNLIDSIYGKIKFGSKINYTYQTQAIGLGYQFSSKSIFKNFALFGGTSIDFGMLVLKQINNFYYWNSSNISVEDNFYSTFARANCNLGIKYNFSCDINFFFQAEAGLIQYGKEIKTNGRYMGASFGIRYKFLEEQDKLNYKNNSFW